MLLYIGTYSLRGSKGIYALRFDPNTGALSEAGWAGGDVQNPSFLALHPNRKFLYAAGETNDGVVASFAVDTASGKLTPLSKQSSGGGGPCFVTVDPSGKSALIANYNTGSVAALPIGKDGSVQPISAKIQHTGASKADPKRQEGPHAHTIHVDSKDRFAIACDLGLDKLLVYKFDAGRGTLTPNTPPFTATKPGAGPRQFAFSPDNKFGYAVNELDSTITTFKWDGGAGTLTPVETLSTLPDGYSGPNSHPAEVQVHPSGKWVYMSNRGPDTIAIFAVDKGSGKLKPVDYAPSGGKNPRHFGIDPSGKWLISAHQDSDTLVAHKIDERTGKLTPGVSHFTIPAAVCVLFVPGT